MQALGRAAASRGMKVWVTVWGPATLVRRVCTMSADGTVTGLESAEG